MTTQTRYKKFDRAMIGKVVTLTVTEGLKLVFSVTGVLEGYSVYPSALYAYMPGVNRTAALTSVGQELTIDVLWE